MLLLLNLSSYIMNYHAMMVYYVELLGSAVVYIHAINSFT